MSTDHQTTRTRRDTADTGRTTDDGDADAEAGPLSAAGCCRRRPPEPPPRTSTDGTTMPATDSTPFVVDSVDRSSPTSTIGRKRFRCQQITPNQAQPPQSTNPAPSDDDHLMECAEAHAHWRREMPLLDADVDPAHSPRRKVARHSLSSPSRADSVEPCSPNSLPALSPDRKERAHERAASSPHSATASNFSSSRSTSPRLHQTEPIILDSLSPPKATFLHDTHGVTNLQLPTSSCVDSQVPAAKELNSMRSRFMKGLSMPFTMQLCMPDDHTMTSDSKLGGLVIPLATHPSPSMRASTSKRSPMVGSRSLTPPPSYSPCTSASLLSPFAFSRSFDSIDGGIQSSSSKSGVSLHQGPRPSQQDSACCHPAKGFFAIADGHGRTGHIVAALATSLLPGMYAAACQTADSPEEAWRQSFEALDAHIIQHTNFGGCTALAAHISTDPSTSVPRRTLHLAHVGDSRAVLSRFDGCALALTQDHKPDLPAERAAIEARGGTVTQARRQRVGEGRFPTLPTQPSTPQHGKHPAHPFSSAFAAPLAPLDPSAACTSGTPTVSTPTAAWRVDGLLNLSRALGDAHLKPSITGVPSCHRHAISHADEFVILATDGVWSVMTDQQAVTVVREFIAAQATADLASQRPIHSLAARAADHLAVTALQRGSLDNTSALIIMLN